MGESAGDPLTPVPKDDYWYDVSFTDARVGDALVQVGGRAAALRRTTDGGVTWAVVP